VKISSLKFKKKIKISNFSPVSDESLKSDTTITT